jgi:hypothetical protein
MVLQGQSMAHNMSITLKCVESMFKRLESNWSNRINSLILEYMLLLE